MSRTRVPEATRRAIFMRSHGRCEYLNCSKVVASVEGDFSISVTGEFAHIVPVGDGPRSGFKEPASDLNRTDNILLLCRDHHRLIDHEEVEQHPPAVLFTMVSRRHERLEEEIDAFLSSDPFGFRCEELAEEIRIGRVVTLLNDFRLAGPTAGMTHLKAARRLLLEIERNPHVHLPPNTLALIDLSISAMAASVAFNPEAFVQELRHSERRFRAVTDTGVAAAALQMMVFVRDEHGVLDSQRRLAVIKDVLSSIDRTIKSTSDDRVKAGLLGIKSALVRWRARIEIKRARANSLVEAKACASASLRLGWSRHGLLQFGLTRYAHARSLPGDKFVEYTSEIAAADEALLDRRLDDYLAAIKYRPRYLRDTHRWPEALRSFWLAVEMGLERDMQLTAFLAGEAAASAFAQEDADSNAVENVNAFLADAIVAGFDHGRNMLTWVYTRALLDRSWFRGEFVERLEGTDGRAELGGILKDVSRRYLNMDPGRQDVLFGVNDVEFWNSVARTCQVALSDPETALRYYGVAERYSGRVAGNLTTRMGMARCNFELGRLSEAKAHCGMAAHVAPASHIEFVQLLQAQVSIAGEGATSTSG